MAKSEIITPIEGYRERVRALIEARDGTPILNGSHEHAAVLTQEAFSHASTEIRILCTRLDPDCYGREDVRNAARFFLADRDHKARVLIEEALWNPEENFEWYQHPFVRDLAAFASSHDGSEPRLQMKRVPKKWIDQYTYNFLLLDDYGFRFEEDRTKSAAVARFLPPGKPAEAITRLGSIFDQLWAVSPKLALSEASA